MKDHYAILGIAVNASQEKIKNAYRQKASLYHPDKNIGTALADIYFKLANEAYEILSDTEKRRTYDISRNIEILSDPHATAEEIWITFLSQLIQKE